METGFMNRITGLVIALVVGGLLVGGLLIPTVQGMTTTEKTYTNEGMPYAAVDEDTHTLIFTSNNINVDGADIDLSLFPGNFSNYSVVFSENGFIRWDRTNVMFSCNMAGGVNQVAQFNCSTYTVTVTITGNSAVISSTDTSVISRQIDNVLYYVAPAGDYVLSLNPHVTETTQMMGAGISFITQPEFINIYLVWDGTITDIEAPYYFSGASYTANYLGNEVNKTNITTNLYKIDSITFDFELTKNDSTVNATVTYTYFIAPLHVTYENNAYIGATNAILIGVISLLGTVALIVIAANGIRNKY